MNRPLPRESRAGELIALLTDGAITAEEQHELMQMLRTDPAARDEYFEQIHLHAMLHWVESAPPVKRSPAPPRVRAAEAAAPPLAIFAADEPLAAPRRHPLGFTLAVTSLTVALWTLLFVLLAGETPQGGEVAPASSVASVAQLTGAVDCRWEESSGDLAVGRQLAPGRDLTLQSGVAEVTFKSGARVVLTGPTRVRLDGANSGLLSRGRLTAYVPPRAVGFAVRTPDAVLVDLQTEFAVAVDPAGITDIHVFLGRVEVQRIKSGDGGAPNSPQNQLLVMNEALRINGQQGSIEPLAIDLAQRQQLPARRRGRIAFRHLALAPGQQDTPSTLGHDFVVNRPIVVTHLGVFDSAGDGLKRPITAELWTRDAHDTPDNFADDQPRSRVATLRFTPSEPGELFESSRFKPVPGRLVLPPGDYTMVAYGYGPEEPFGNSRYAEDAEYKALDDGDGAIAFVGGSRFGEQASQPHTTFPLKLGRGPADRYRAGTFEFELADDEPAVQNDR